MSPLAYIAAFTKRIRLGTGVAQLAARTPANLAMTAQTIDALAGGNRMILGIGVSGPQIVEGWYGQPWGKPNARLRDTVAIVKRSSRARRRWSMKAEKSHCPTREQDRAALRSRSKHHAWQPEHPDHAGHHNCHERSYDGRSG